VDEENRLVEERRSKLAALRAKGPAFPNDFVRRHYAADLAAAHGGAANEALEASPVEAALAGRLMLKRVMGKACFGTLRDMTGSIQIFVSDGDTGSEALAAFKLLAELEGILPALETAHAIAHCAKVAPTLRKDQVIVVNLSGRGDKDCQEVARLLDEAK
jgi:lysyl-tRNA synthetase class II